MTQGVFGFFGPFRFLSNFHLVEVEFDGLVFPSTEHAYQAAKSLDPEVRQVFATEVATPRDARKLGQQIPLTDDWHTTRKFDVMLELTRKKFANDPLKRWLLATGDMYLEETNAWGDVCWGVCKGVGENRLGKILMQVRGELK